MFIIAGLYRRQRLITPKGPQTRPTASRLREALFNICQHHIEGAVFLDIFAGSGAMGFEALSRGAQSATFIDSHKESVDCIRSNSALLKVQDRSQIFRGEAVTMLNLLNKQGKKFDIIYADPPYNTLDPSGTVLYSTQMIQWIDTHDLLTPRGLLFIEEDFRSEPKIESLNSLQFKDSRRFGQAVLQKYQKK